jgi:hypothetical protein
VAYLNPSVVSERLRYLLALRNYAFTSRDLRAFTPQLTADSNHRNPSAGGVAQPSAMQIAEGALVYKLRFSAARVSVRLLQIDIAVNDGRAGATGWYFASYAYDRSVQTPSPGRRMVPVGLMWGNDPNGPPLTQSWINPNAPLYARQRRTQSSEENGASRSY